MDEWTDGWADVVEPGYGLCLRSLDPFAMFVQMMYSSSSRHVMGLSADSRRVVKHHCRRQVHLKETQC